MSEKGIKNTKINDSKIKQFETEEKFYDFLGLEWIPPELREDSGEIEAALRSAQGKPNGLPKLIELEDIKADLQMHSDYNIETSHDLGASSMKDLVQKASELGYEYIAFTEHNPSRSKHTDQEIEDILKRKKEVVEQLNYSLVKDVKSRVLKVFNSLEIDIRPDGSLAVPEKALDLLDFALVSIHSNFRGDKASQTTRILKALNHPKVKIFAHPTGRKIDERESVDADYRKIFEFCAKNNKYLEINCDPMRLDLPDFFVKEAKDIECMFSLGTDAHHKDGMNNMSFGISVARRGWLSAKEVINTRNLSDFEKLMLK